MAARIEVETGAEWLRTASLRSKAEWLRAAALRSKAGGSSG